MTAAIYRFAPALVGACSLLGCGASAEPNVRGSEVSGEQLEAPVDEQRAVPARTPDSKGGEAKLASLTPSAADDTASDATDGVSDDRDADEPLLLAGPSIDGWQPVLGPGSEHERSMLASVDRDDFPLTALTDDYLAPLYRDSKVLGWAREGTRLPVRKYADSGCSGGKLYEAPGNVFLCERYGFDIRNNQETPGAPRNVYVKRPVPFSYARVMAKRAPRLERLPRADEIAELDEAVAERKRMRSLVDRWLEGDYFLAIDGEEKVGDRVFYRTVTGTYARAEDVKMLPVPTMHGEHLGDEVALPLAFVLEDTEVYCQNEDDGLDTCGEAEKHARFPAKGTLEHDGDTYVRGPDGVALDRDVVRVVERVDRPRGVPADAKWAHIDLSQQALVAYEGDEPVYVTLISSGRDGYHTPGGLYRVERKYLSKSMAGKDIETKLPYLVEEVPWTMYYDGNFAVHGAYWHNKFGKTKSHGCTNVPPVDARWLYYWSEPDLPEGIHAVKGVEDGTWFYFTGQSPPDGK